MRDSPHVSAPGGIRTPNQPGVVTGSMKVPWLMLRGGVDPREPTCSLLDDAALVYALMCPFLRLLIGHGGCSGHPTPAPPGRPGGVARHTVLRMGDKTALRAARRQFHRWQPRRACKAPTRYALRTTLLRVSVDSSSGGTAVIAESLPRRFLFASFKGKDEIKRPRAATPP